MYKVSHKPSISDVIWVDEVINRGVSGMGMTEVRCFNLEQFKEFGKGRDIYGCLRKGSMTMISECYYFVRNNMLFRHTEQVPNPIAYVASNLEPHHEPEVDRVENIVTDGQSIFFNPRASMKKTENADQYLVV